MVVSVQKMRVDYWDRYMAHACCAQEKSSTIFAHTHNINIFGSKGAALLGTL
jgi:hypothetical protein